MSNRNLVRSIDALCIGAVRKFSCRFPRSRISAPTTPYAFHAGSSILPRAPSVASNSLRNIAQRCPNQHVRTFSTSKILQKNPKRDGYGRSSVVEAGARLTPLEEAFDFSELESKILKTIESFTHELALLRANGKFDPRFLEELQVKIEKEHTVQLRDVAQVVAKGRNINVILAEERHIKPVRSAIQASQLSINPQGPTPEAPMTLTIPIPPPTAETRQEALKEASRYAQGALDRIRNAQHGSQKRLRGNMAKVLPRDDIRKARKRSDEIVKKGNDEIKRILEGAKSVLEGK